MSKPTPAQVRQRIVAWAHWMVFHKAQIHYEEIRPMPLTSRLPLTNDCSATATLCYYLAGAPDPNHLRYNGYGYTGTLVQHGQMIAENRVLPGDLVIYFDDSGCFNPANSQHVAVVVYGEKTGNPMTMSHGWSGEPSLVRVSDDGRPHRYYRYATNYRF